MGQQGDYGRAGYSQPGGDDPWGWSAAVPEGWQNQYQPSVRQSVPQQFQPQSQFNPGQQYAPPPEYAPPVQYAPPRQRGRRAGRKVIGGIVGLVAVIIVIGVAANGGGHGVKTGATSAAGGGGPKMAGIGSGITLAGNGSGEQVSVTVVKVIATAEPGDEFSGASVGKRLYAVQFRLKDTGSAAYSDAPSNGAAVVDSSGQSYDAQIAGSAVGCPSFSSPENITAGSSGLGCITFEVPATAKISKVQFTLDSGLGPDTGQWNVG